MPRATSSLATKEPAQTSCVYKCKYYAVVNVHTNITRTAQIAGFILLTRKTPTPLTSTIVSDPTTTTGCVPSPPPPPSRTRFATCFRTTHCTMKFFGAFKRMQDQTNKPSTTQAFVEPEKKPDPAIKGIRVFTTVYQPKKRPLLSRAPEPLQPSNVCNACTLRHVSSYPST